jgi:hypothetical protein
MSLSVISWRSLLLVEETGGPGENHRPVASHWQTLSHNVVSLKTYMFVLTSFALIPMRSNCASLIADFFHGGIGIRMSECLLFTLNEQLFSYLMTRTSYIKMRWWCPLCTRPTCTLNVISWQEQVTLWWDEDVPSVLDQDAEFDSYSVSSQKQQSADRRVAPRHYSDSESTSPCSYFLVLHA